jgi:hypothetical protein
MADKVTGTLANVPLKFKELPDGSFALAIATETGNPLSAAPSRMTLTQTIVTLAAATSAPLIAANPNRKYLSWMVVGANPATIVPGAGPAVAGTGMNYNPGSSAIHQGGSQSFEGPAVPTNAFAAISTGGTTVVVWEGE